MVWYFAYGSNMNPARLVEARLRPEGVEVASRVCGRLDDWRLAFNKLRQTSPPSGAGNIVMSPGETVYGTLNEMPEAGLAVLDRYEGVTTGQYRREIVKVVRSDTGQPVEAVTYVALKLGADDLRPLREYLAHLLAGRDLLPADYCARLERQGLAD
ncbi:MAG: gamma-glutamylcyclotransferase [Rhodospirillaceae bacterium]|nr:gamma-glutamylcyclotransferase [Rhodospirillaceae bacterium]